MNSTQVNIGEGHPCFVIAEIGLNHNGQYELACDLVKAAAKAGVDAVKFQNFLTEDFLTDRSVLYTYTNEGVEKTEPLFDICKRSEFQREWIVPLKSLCDELGIVFMSTPTSEQGILDLVENGATVIKNGSDYITHVQLLEFMGAKGDYAIISTGMADRSDVEFALEAVRRGGKATPVILQCISNYPTEDENVNLRKMTTLRRDFDVLVGFSDHTWGWTAAVQAVTLGACVIEKHFTLDRGLPGPDHLFSSTPDEMQKLMEEIRRAEKRMGDPEIRPSESEMHIKDEYRVGLVANADLKKGDVLSEDVISIRKPAKGLLPREIDQCLGRVLTRDIGAGQPISADCFEGDNG